MASHTKGEGGAYVVTVVNIFYRGGRSLKQCNITHSENSIYPGFAILSVNDIISSRQYICR